MMMLGCWHVINCVRTCRNVYQEKNFTNFAISEILSRNFLSCVKDCMATFTALAKIYFTKFSVAAPPGVLNEIVAALK